MIKILYSPHRFLGPGGAHNGSPWGEIMAIDTVSENKLNAIKKL